MSLPVKHGGVSILIQRTTFDRYNDPTYTDSHYIEGCLEFIGFSTTGRPALGTEVENSVQDRRTVYAPIGSDVVATDRAIIIPGTSVPRQPDGTIIPLDANSSLRKTNTYQVLGRPMEWVNPLNNWAPGMEIILVRTS